jgi:Phosphatase
MDVVDSHARRLPSLDDRWVPRAYDHGELVAGLLRGRVAGPVTSHPMDNVRRNIAMLAAGDPDKQFGMTGLPGAMGEEDILAAVGRMAGFDPRIAPAGPTPIDPERVLEDCDRVGVRLAVACERGERVLLATGHPHGLILLYAEIGRELTTRGAKLLRPFDGGAWTEGRTGRLLRIRYLSGVAIAADDADAKHTHAGEPMFAMLEETTPDLVIADHGFAGGAIERGIETLSVADVNDPALVVARALGRTRDVVVMDDNVRPDAYWPCYQAIAARLPARLP